MKKFGLFIVMAVVMLIESVQAGAQEASPFPSEAIAQHGRIIDMNGKDQAEEDLEAGYSNWLVVYDTEIMYTLAVSSYENCLEHAKEVDTNRYSTYCSSL